MLQFVDVGEKPMFLPTHSAAFSSFLSVTGLCWTRAEALCYWTVKDVPLRRVGGVGR